jgi:predicted MFS family arabinose efflux permease
MLSNLTSRRGHGWRVVGTCFVAAVFTWGLGVFGASVYLSEVTKTRGWSVSLVSSGITVFYLTAAVLLPLVGAAIDRYGPRALIPGGAVLMALSVAAVGQAAAAWQLLAAFVGIGLGYATMSVTGLSATIAPWFERHQGRAVAMALTGASVGAMVVVPLLTLSIARYGFAATTAGAAAVMIGILVPLGLIVLRFRGPAELGVGRDGAEGLHEHEEAARAPAWTWTRARALRSPAIWSVAIGFALGLTAQVGFFTHQVKLADPVLGVTGAGWLVGATGLAGLLGRLLLAWLADRIELRGYTAAILATQAVALVAMAFAPTAPVLIAMSMVYGFCLGQITTLSPIVVRREFGAEAFGAVYGVAGTVIQFSSAFGPALYGVARDAFGSYPPVLMIAAGFELAALVVVLAGRPRRRR